MLELVAMSVGVCCSGSGRMWSDVVGCAGLRLSWGILGEVTLTVAGKNYPYDAKGKGLALTINPIIRIIGGWRVSGI